MAMPESPGDGWIENAGQRPDKVSKRIRVFLRKGVEPRYADAIDKMAAPGWASDTTRWSLKNDPHDVAWWRPL